MKKNLWILLALSALIAMFVISGCQKAVTPTPTPTPTATAQPTPTPDANCPKVVSTEVVKTYDPQDCGYTCTACGCSNPPPCETCPEPVYSNIYSNCYCEEWSEIDYVKTCGPSTGTFKIVITFDENIDPLKSGCVLDPTNWEVKVKNNERLTKELIAAPYNIEIDGKKIIVDAFVGECGTRKITDYCNACPGTDIYYSFCGLICNLNDANCYALTLNGGRTAGLNLIPAPTIADEITWKILSNCVVSDEKGNYCCGFEGKDCCVEPICETCEPCPIEGSICQ